MSAANTPPSIKLTKAVLLPLAIFAFFKNLAALLTLDPSFVLVISKTLSVTTGILLGLDGIALRTEILEFGARGSSTRAVVRGRRERAVRAERIGIYILVAIRNVGKIWGELRIWNSSTEMTITEAKRKKCGFI